MQLAALLLARPRPKLLLIEDVASCINDYKARIKVQKAIHAVLSQLEGTTVLIVTDHPLTLQLASRVVVLKEGQISESGTHHELLQGENIYQRMVT